MAMAKAYPSMIALLGLLAVAGYQHRDKIAEMIKRGADNLEARNIRNKSGDTINQDGDKTGDFESVLDSIHGALNSSGAGWLSNALTELVDRFKQNGRQDVAQSWVRQGPNRGISPDELEEAIGSDILNTLSEQTKLPREEILARLSRQLPDAVDKYTPDGRVPAASEAA
jgi:uncharacterized protein YidB (DUF937 family)